MKKRLIAGIISISLMVAFYAEAGAAISYAGQEQGSLSGAEKTGEMKVQNGTVYFEKKDQSLLQPKTRLSGQAVGKPAALPSFSLVDEGKVTNIRNQGSSDNCWSYGALASMESGLIMAGKAKNTLNLSENHLTWFSYKGANTSAKNLYAGKDTFLSSKSPYKAGGNRTMATATLARWFGAADQERANSAAALSSGLRTTADIHLKNADYLPDPTTAAGRKTIKQYLVTKGAVDISYYDNDRYMKGNKSAYYCTINAIANHEVAIVGWDDNFSKNNFASTPSGNGAWIVRNSWGSSWGNNGYFYLSYYDKSLEEPTFFEAESREYQKDNTEHDYSGIYQYDGIGPGDAEFSIKSKLSAANRYVARQDELLQAIGTYTTAANSTVNVSVYVSPSSGNPESGVKEYTKSFSVPYAGYHTLELGRSIGIPKGYAFSIVIATSYTQNGKKWYSLPTELQMTNYEVLSSIDVSKGQSYLYTNDKWQDVTKMKKLQSGGAYYKVGNVLAKAFTGKAGISPQEVVIPDTSIKAVCGSASVSLGAERMSGTGKLLYKSSDTAVASVTASGKISFKGAGKAIITAAAAPDASSKSAAASVEVIVTPKKGKIKSVTSHQRKTISVSWSKMNDVTGYQIAAAQNENFTKGKKSVTVSGADTNKKVIKNVSSQKTYYVKVRAFKTLDGTKLYGAYSEAVKIRTR